MSGINVDFGLGRAVVLSQNTSQFCRVCCCQPNINWNVLDHEDPNEDITKNMDGEDGVKHLYFIEEQATWFGRTCSFCLPGWRKTNYLMHKGADENGEVKFTHEKGWTCGQNMFLWSGDGGNVRVPCCCFLPNLTTKDVNGNVIGSTKYICDTFLFVPRFDIFDAQGNSNYMLRPDTCCMGCCVLCTCCAGAGGSDGMGTGRSTNCFKVPIYLRDPNTREKLTGDPAVSYLWTGWEKECCTKRDMYDVVFPHDATQKQKATIIGSALLFDITFSEQE